MENRTASLYIGTHKLDNTMEEHSIQNDNEECKVLGTEDERCRVCPFPEGAALGGQAVLGWASRPEGAPHLPCWAAQHMICPFSLHTDLVWPNSAQLWDTQLPSYQLTFHQRQPRSWSAATSRPSEVQPLFSVSPIFRGMSILLPICL